MKKQGVEFRKQMFDLYGFTASAQELIRAKSGITIRDFFSTRGGGFWHPSRKLVELFTAQHQAAVHELSHVFWEYFRKNNPHIKEALCRDVIILADMNTDENFEFTQSIAHAHGYAYGIGDWIGMYGNADSKNNPKNLPKNLHNLTEEDFKRRVNDWEIYAGFASFLMGKFKDGPRKLPEFMWQYFEPLFTGEIKTTPYYIEGGHP